MNRLILILALFAFCCVVYGNSDICPVTVTAFPPNPDSNCCGVDGVGSSKFIGGLITNLDDYPWVVLIEYVKEDGKRSTPCGGALISGRYVLTAAHCFTSPDSGKPENILLGVHDTSIEGRECVTTESGDKDCNLGVTRIPIEKVITHTEFHKPNTYMNDIALIRMAKKAPYTDFIRPICLPTKDINHRTGSISLRKAGWGFFKTDEHNSVKVQLKLPFVPPQKCQAEFNDHKINISLWKSQICAGGDNAKDFCIGDGGLPLSYIDGWKSEVVGIVSFGVTCSSSVSLPVVYTNVYQYMAWIQNNIVA